MIVLGIILLIIGFIAKAAILWTIGIILVVVGLAPMVLGMMGRAVGGRRHYRLNVPHPVRRRPHRFAMTGVWSVSVPGG